MIDEVRSKGWGLMRLGLCLAAAALFYQAQAAPNAPPPPRRHRVAISTHDLHEINFVAHPLPPRR